MVSIKLIVWVQLTNIVMSNVSIHQKYPQQRRIFNYQVDTMADSVDMSHFLCLINLFLAQRACGKK